MVEDKWLLLFGVPVILILLMSIRRRIAAINTRMRQLEREASAKPINPYKSLFELMQRDSPQTGGRDKQNNG